MATGGPCGEVGCLKVSRKRGLCCTHYNRRYQPHRSHGPVPIAEWRKLNPDRVSKNYEIKRRRRRARKALAKTERYTLAEIATRDRFICQLCGKRVAMSETVPHPRAPTIDHIIPFAEVPDDTRANVQLAQQLALFG